MNKALLTYLVWPLVKFLIAFVIVQVIVAAMNWVERRLLGLFQARLGPNRVGPKGLLQIIADPIKFHYVGPKDAETVIVSWGSTKGAILDALDRLRAEKASVGFLQLRLLNPFPGEAVMAHLAKAKRRIDIEMNFSGQLGGLIRERTGVDCTHHVVKYNGRPMSSSEVYDAVERIIHDKAEKRTVLTLGA